MQIFGQSYLKGAARLLISGAISERPIYSITMAPLLMPLYLLILMFAGWISRRQLDVIECLQEENRCDGTVLHKTIGKKLLIIWDRLTAHRSKLVREHVEAQRGHIALQFLPAYAPEMNPVECVCGYLKHHAMPN